MADIGGLARLGPWRRGPPGRLAMRAVAIAMAAGLFFDAGAFGGWGEAQAQTQTRSAPPVVTYRLDDANVVRQLVVSVDKSQIVQTDRPFGEVLIGNAEIADVVPLTDTSLYILARRVGATRISILDPEKHLLSVIELEVSYDLDGLRQRIRERLPHANVTATSVHGRVLLAGTVPDAVALEMAVAIANQYAPNAVQNALAVRASQQVMLEVRFIEANRTAGRDIGVNWLGNRHRASGAIGAETSPRHATEQRFDDVGNIITTFAPPPLLSGNVLGTAIDVLAFPSGGAAFGTFVARLIANGATADVVIQALEERGVARRLAEPNLIALSGDTASFLAGGEFPVPVPQEEGQITIQFKEFGVGLGFTPTVLDDGKINLKIVPEVSELDFSTAVSVAGTTVPGLSTRRASTTIELRDGQSFAIAGLLQSDSRTQLAQLPWIGKVPVLGALFRSASYQKGETELVIIVTPRLVKPAIPGQKLATPLDSQLPANDKDFFLKGKQEIDKKFPTGYGHVLEVEEGWKSVVDGPSLKDAPRSLFQPTFKGFAYDTFKR